MSSLRRSVVRAWLAPVLLLGVLAACGDGSHELPAQKWHDMEVRVEPRPSPLQQGTSEILVTVTNVRGKPAYNLVVSLRASDRESWTQAIEDGQVGVYRRAIKLDPNASDVQVRIRRDSEEGVLRFPLKP